MGNVLKIVGILGGGAVIATALASSSSPTPQPAAVYESLSTEQVAETEETTTVPKATEKSVPTPAPAPVPKPKPVSNCHPSYSGCLKINAGDYDCASGSGNGPNYTGAVQVYGSDPFDLDRDNDGWGCE